jgi:hypothetical protein
VAAIFGIFSGFWLSYAALLTGLAHGLVGRDMQRPLAWTDRPMLASRDLNNPHGDGQRCGALAVSVRPGPPRAWVMGFRPSGRCVRPRRTPAPRSSS